MSPPLEVVQLLECLVKDLGGDVFRLFVAGNPPHHVGIDPVKMALVELGKARTVALRRLDQLPVVAKFFLENSQRVLRRSLGLLNKINGGQGQKVTRFETKFWPTPRPTDSKGTTPPARLVRFRASASGDDVKHVSEAFRFWRVGRKKEREKIPLR